MSWLDNATIYHIFIDRFAGFKSTDNWQKPIYIGGNLKGIIGKLPYIQALGVNAIWLSPFYKGSAYHGYHITDYYKVDPHFGTLKDLKELIQKAHQRNLKVICDFVPNHLSHQHPYFVDAISNPKSKYRDWFLFTTYPTNYRDFLGYKELPQVNLDNPDVVEYLQSAARQWLDLGIDGFRVDFVIGISNANLNKLFNPLRQEYRDLVLFGESWLQGVRYRHLSSINMPNKFFTWLLKRNESLYLNYASMFDGILDFKMIDYIKRYVNQPNDHLKSIMKAHINRVKKNIMPITFLDNHDIERFLFLCGNDLDKLKLAIRTQFELNKTNVIYYGTEIGMTQNKPFAALKDYRDILAREPMRWTDVNKYQELIAYYKKIIAQQNN